MQAMWGEPSLRSATWLGHGKNQRERKEEREKPPNPQKGGIKEKPQKRGIELQTPFSL